MVNEEKMGTAVLAGEFPGGSWRCEFRQDGLADCRMKCMKNGSEAPELLDVLLSVFADVLRKRIPSGEPSLENSCVGEGLTGEFSLSSKDKGELTEAELASCQASIRDAFAEFLETHPDEAKLITENAMLSARALNAARQVRALMQKRPVSTFDFPELPKRIRWATPATDMQQIRLDLLATLSSGSSDHAMLRNCQKLQKELQQSKDARIMAYFKSDFDRALELLDEKLNLHGLARRISLPGDITLRLGFLPSRYAAWRLELEFTDIARDPDKADILAARITEIPGLKRRGNRLWRVSLGPIGSLPTFRKAAWPIYVRVYNQLRAICLEIFQP